MLKLVIGDSLKNPTQYHDQHQHLAHFSDFVQYEQILCGNKIFNGWTGKVRGKMIQKLAHS